MCHDLLAAFAAHERDLGRSPRTIQGRALVLRRLERRVCALEATSDDVGALVAGMAASTRNWYLTMLSGFYRYAIRRGATDSDPTLLVDRASEPRRLPRPCSPADLSMALRLADLRMRVVLCLAAFAGLRCVEIAGLACEDVTRDALFVASGKGGHQRMIPMNPLLWDALERYGLADSGPVVRKRRGSGHMGARTLSNFTNGYLRSVGLAVTPHQLRHWFGTETWRRMPDKDLLVLRDLMGHASARATEGYTKVVVDDRAAAAVQAIAL